MIIISKKQVDQLLPMGKAIEKIEEIMPFVSQGVCNLPLRSAIEVCKPNLFGIMPGVIPKINSVPACFGIKLISLYPNNPANGKSSHLGSMMLFDSEFGEPIALMDAGILTAIRTAAASAVATNILSRKDSHILSLIGAGEQALSHLDAITHIRDISEVRIVARSIEKAEKFILGAQTNYPNISFSAGDSVKAAVAGADIVCSVTSSKEIVLKGKWIGPGTHVNAVGASIPTMREIDSDLIVKSAVYIDYFASALAQAADIISAINDGLIQEADIRGEIGQVMNGTVQGRNSTKEITLYRSLGIAAQDLICAQFIYAQALSQNIGTKVDLN